MDEPLLRFKSHIEGKNADVEVYIDRIEWAQEGRLTMSRLAGKAVTVGKMSARKGRSSEVIPVSSISSVTIERDGFRQAVKVICSGNTIDFRVGRGEAENIKSLLTDLMLGKHSAQAGSPAPSSTAPPAATASLSDELTKLAALRDAGVLTEDEFAEQKAKLLG